MRIGLAFVFAVALAVSGSGAALADDDAVVTSKTDAVATPKTGLFTDPADEHFDMSRWLLEHHGFLPVPIIVSDPAVGFGGGVGLAFFHRPKDSSPTRTKPDGSTEMISPDIYGFGVMATENGTKALGGGAILHFDDDRWRYRGGVGVVNMNMDFYTKGALLPEQKIGVN